MSFRFQPAKRENVSLLIGLIGASGSGKTYTAMRLASGICGDKPFAVIDTEAGRAKHYADQFKFDHGDLKPPFRPGSYSDAIKAADDAHYPVIVVDSCSHEWAGDGGILDWQEDELTRMAGDDYAKRDRVKMAAWIKPKMGHKAMIQKLLQVRAHLILCFRAEEKVEMVKNPQTGKMEIVPKKSSIGLDGWMPVCEKNMPYELTTSFLLMSAKPGIPHPIKLQEQHRSIFPLEQQINEQSGKRLAAWATGAKPTESAPLDAGTPSGAVTQPLVVIPAGADPITITQEQVDELTELIMEAGMAKSKVLKQAGVDSLALFTPDDYLELRAVLQRKIGAKVGA
jgi:hypothetical protein